MPDAGAVAHHVRPHLASNASLRTRGGQFFLRGGPGLVAVLAAWAHVKGILVVPLIVYSDNGAVPELMAISMENCRILQSTKHISWPKVRIQISSFESTITHIQSYCIR